MSIKMTSEVTCDSCNKIIVFNGTQKTGFIVLLNQPILNEEGTPQFDLAEAVPVNTCFCDVQCMKNYNTAPVS